MKIRLLIIILAFFQSYLCFSQVQNTNQIIEISKEKLKKLVGNDLFQFYTFEPESQFQFQKKNGKTKWTKLNPNKRINGHFLKAQIQFYFRNPNFDYNTNKTTYIKLDENLNLINKPFIEFIPEYLKDKNAEKWLTEIQINKIISTIDFKKSSYPKYKQLIFNENTNSYYWEITNTLSEKPKVSEVEIIRISTIDGKILERKEELQYTY